MVWVGIGWYASGKTGIGLGLGWYRFRLVRLPSLVSYIKVDSAWTMVKLVGGLLTSIITSGLVAAANGQVGCAICLYWLIAGTRSFFPAYPWCFMCWSGMGLFVWGVDDEGKDEEVLLKLDA